MLWLSEFIVCCFVFVDAFDNPLILKTLQDILDGRVCKIPVYDFKTNSRCENVYVTTNKQFITDLIFRKLDEFVTIYPADVLLFEGILVFYFPEIREVFHMKLFVDTDADTRLSRRGFVVTAKFYMKS